MSKKLGIDFQLQKLQRLAPAGYAVGLHIRFASATLSYRTYPKGWLDLYTQKGFILSDPALSWCVSNQGTCRWSQLSSNDPQDILGQAATFGLTYGVVVSHGHDGSRSIGGFARSDREFTDGEISEIADIVAHLHVETAPPNTLTDAQAAALRLIADGNRHSQVAAELGITEGALKARLTFTREALFARTTTEAVQRALDYELL